MSLSESLSLLLPNVPYQSVNGTKDSDCLSRPSPFGRVRTAANVGHLVRKLGQRERQERVPRRPPSWGVIVRMGGGARDKTGVLRGRDFEILGRVQARTNGNEVRRRRWRQEAMRVPLPFRSRSRLQHILSTAVFAGPSQRRGRGCRRKDFRRRRRRFAAKIGRRRRSQDLVSVFSAGLDVQHERWGVREVGGLVSGEAGEVDDGWRLGNRGHCHRRRELDPGGRGVGHCCRVDALLRRRCREPRSGILIPGEIAGVSVVMNGLRGRRQAGPSWHLRYEGGGSGRHRRPFWHHGRSRLVHARLVVRGNRQGSQVSKRARRRRLLRLVPRAPTLADDESVRLIAGRAREERVADPPFDAVVAFASPPSRLLFLLAGQTRAYGVERCKRGSRGTG